MYEIEVTDNNSEALHKKALVLSYFTVAYNLVEGVVSLIFGYLAGSIALVGFGMDSFVESLSGFVMIWRFRKHGSITKEEEERIELRATRLVAYTFFVLSAYVIYESVTKLYYQEVANPSLPGIIVASVSIVVMPILFYKKYHLGKAIGSRSLVADSKETLACMVLSVALLIGLGMNYFYGLWQADPIVGIVVAGYLIKEGVETLREANE
ncbi:cation diffusion facilitator family transporter [Chloroflexota bacterium]